MNVTANSFFSLYAHVATLSILPHIRAFNHRHLQVGRERINYITKRLQPAWGEMNRAEKHVAMLYGEAVQKVIKVNRPMSRNLPKKSLFIVFVGTVSHCTFVPHLHYQLSKTCSRHIFSHVPTSLTSLTASQSTSSAHCTTLAMLLRLRNCRVIIIFIVIIRSSTSTGAVPHTTADRRIYRFTTLHRRDTLSAQDDDGDYRI